MCYPVCGVVHIKYLLLLIRKSSPCSGSNAFPLSLSEWSFTICMTPLNCYTTCAALVGVMSPLPEIDPELSPTLLLVIII